MLKTKLKKGLILAVSILLSGCATYYSVRMNGYLDTQNTTKQIAPGASFCVLQNKDSKNPILDSEIKTKVEKLLLQKGYKIASYEQADFYLSYFYGIGPGRSATEVSRFIILAALRPSRRLLRGGGWELPL